MISYHRYEFHNLKSLRAITNVNDKMLFTFNENCHILSFSFINLFGLLIKRKMLLVASVASSCPIKAAFHAIFPIAPRR